MGHVGGRVEQVERVGELGWARWFVAASRIGVESEGSAEKLGKSIRPPRVGEVTFALENVASFIPVLKR